MPRRDPESLEAAPPPGLREPGAILLVSCYELGHPPFALASPAAFLERAGFAPALLDTAVDRLEEAPLARARLVAISVPMHTALRLGVRVAERVRAANPAAKVAMFGLYASLNADHLLEASADFVIGGEFEAALVALAEALDAAVPGSIAGVRARGDGPVRPNLARLDFATPSRGALPALDRYARLDRDGRLALAGYVEASRGCLHLCLHCPIPPVYEGRFFVVPQAIVLADIRAQVAAGAEHVTFGDPDFLNGPEHSLRIVRAMHAEFPALSFDFTAKIEHVLSRREMFPELEACGCAFMVSAVESLSDVVLQNLVKGHTRADVLEALRITRAAGIALRPSLVSFTPWTTLADYLDVLETIDAEALVREVDAVQLSIRLLVPPGSALLESAAMRPHLRALDQASFMWRWAHPDPRVDALARDVAARVAEAARAEEDADETFASVREIAYAAAGRAPPSRERHREAPRPRSPRLTEPWFC